MRFIVENGSFWSLWERRKHVWIGCSNWSSSTTLWRWLSSCCRVSFTFPFIIFIIVVFNSYDYDLFLIKSTFFFVNLEFHLIFLILYWLFIGYGIVGIVIFLGWLYNSCCKTIVEWSIISILLFDFVNEMDIIHGKMWRKWGLKSYKCCAMHFFHC